MLACAGVTASARLMRMADEFGGSTRGRCRLVGIYASARKKGLSTRRRRHLHHDGQEHRRGRRQAVRADDASLPAAKLVEQLRVAQLFEQAATPAGRSRAAGGRKT